MNGYNVVCEILQKFKDVSFVIHSHLPRHGSEHYDLRFGNPLDAKKLFSFAMPKNFLDTVNTKTLLIKTKDHLERWLTLSSYRLKTIDKGTVTIKIATQKYFEVEFNGKILNGMYRIFKIRNMKRDDLWLLIKNS